MTLKFTLKQCKCYHTVEFFLLLSRHLRPNQELVYIDDKVGLTKDHIKILSNNRDIYDAHYWNHSLILIYNFTLSRLELIVANANSESLISLRREFNIPERRVEYHSLDLDLRGPTVEFEVTIGEDGVPLNDLIKEMIRSSGHNVKLHSDFNGEGYFKVQVRDKI